MNTNTQRSNQLPEEYIQRVIENTDLVELVGQYVQLKRQGSEYSGLCPFHGEKSPSFSVSPSKQVYLCRGCAATGGPITFLQEHQGMSFLDAIEHMAERAKLPHPSTMRGGQSSQAAVEYKQLVQLNEKAADLYHAELLKAPRVLEYLRGRGVTDQMIKDFKIGFAPSGRQFLLEKLQSEPLTMLHKAGLVARNQDDGSFYDWMSYRVIFPIRNASGQAIAFGGRTLSDKVDSKYINSPETVLFKKGQELYGWHEAKQAVHKTKTAIVAEGYLDTVIPSGYGVRNIVSVMGASIQTPSIERLFKTAEHIIYCFDGDKAGVRAAQRAMDHSLPLIDETHRCSFVFLPEGYDPDEFVIEFGAEKFQELLQGAEPLSKFLLRDIAQRHNINEIEGKARFAQEALASVGLIKSEMLRSLFQSGIKDIVGPDIALKTMAQVSSSVTPQMSVDVPQTSNTAPSRSLFGARAVQARGFAKQAPVTSGPAEAPSLALRIVGMLIKDPEAAQVFNPSWVGYAPRAKPEEVEAVYAIVAACNQQESQPWDAEKLMGHFRGTKTETTIQLARALEDEKVVEDPVEELGKLAHFLIQCKERQMRKATLFKKP